MKGENVNELGEEAGNKFIWILKSQDKKFEFYFARDRESEAFEQ